MTEVTPAERKRRARAAELMGDVLPHVSEDDKPEGWNERPANSSRDEELLRDVPPHHG